MDGGLQSARVGGFSTFNPSRLGDVRLLPSQATFVTRLDSTSNGLEPGRLALRATMDLLVGYAISLSTHAASTMQVGSTVVVAEVGTIDEERL